MSVVAEFLGLTAEGWTAVGSIATLLAVLLGLFTLWRGRVSEIRRTQPIVIAHPSGERRFAEAGEVGVQVLDTWLSNEGEGTAFNVRFGIEYTDVRFPWKHREEDPDTGSRQRVVRTRSELPGSSDRYAIPIPIARASLGPDSDEQRIYWCRYENATGQTWETRNPWQRGGDLDIQRVRLVRIREWRETRKARRVTREFQEALDSEWEVLVGMIHEADDDESGGSEDDGPSTLATGA